MPLRLTQPSRELIGHLNRFGQFRYLEVSYYVRGFEVVALDHVVWELRRYCQPLNVIAKLPDGSERPLRVGVGTNNPADLVYHSALALRRGAESLRLAAPREHLRIDHIDWSPYRVGVDLVEHIGKLQIPLLAGHITDVWCADDIVHVK
ncbi:MAG: hypothetical protein JWM63_2073 [Gammaproteobacteria bacterium]|nr:hypothetical protein [Gammaproteobacteria bacterium]